MKPDHGCLFLGLTPLYRCNESTKRRKRQNSAKTKQQNGRTIPKTEIRWQRPTAGNGFTNIRA